MLLMYNSQLSYAEESAVLVVDSGEKSKEHHSSSKVDTPPNIDSQTFLSHDTETPAAANQRQWPKNQLLFAPRGPGSSQKMQER